MPQESLGFVKLEWTCPKCGSRNPGPQKTCHGCGGPQPENVQFEKAEHQEIITDQSEIELAKAGPDIHCAFCGARNPAGAVTCSQCGADLAEGVKRQTGQVVGAFSSKPVKEISCPRCSAPNPDTALQCAQCGAPLTKSPAGIPSTNLTPVKSKTNPLLLVLGIVFGVLCISAIAFFVINSLRTEAINGVVTNANWVSTIAVEALQPVRYQGWREDIPEKASVGSCSQKLHHVQDQPAPDSVKVCGTPYQVDKGSGFAEVMQDCQYEVYQDYCEYTVMEWQQVNEFRLEGQDYSPIWPEIQLSSDQREGQRDQIFTILFSSTEGQYTYTTSDYDLFQQLQINSQWILEINGLGHIVSIEPAQ